MKEMNKNLMSRKKFLARTVTGFAAIGLVNSSSEAAELSVPKLRRLGNTNIKVTPLCFGAPRTNDESLIKYALGKGINYIDTGRAYGNGNNEMLVGRSVAGIRKNVVIQSKIQLELNELPSGGKGKKGDNEIRGILSAQLEASLKALNTDYIDILLYHGANDGYLVFHEATKKFFSDMKENGVIKAHGFSTHNEDMDLPAKNIEEKFYDVIMLQFNHKGSFVHSSNGRFSEWDQPRRISILEEAAENGTGIIAMKTCSGGKYSPSAGIEPSFKEAVNWVIQHEFISSAAVAMANFEQVDEHAFLLY